MFRNRLKNDVQIVTVLEQRILEFILCGQYLPLWKELLWEFVLKYIAVGLQIVDAAYTAPWQNCLTFCGGTAAMRCVVDMFAQSNIMIHLRGGPHSSSGLWILVIVFVMSFGDLHFLNITHIRPQVIRLHEACKVVAFAHVVGQCNPFPSAESEVGLPTSNAAIIQDNY